MAGTDLAAVGVALSAGWLILLAIESTLTYLTKRS